MTREELRTRYREEMAYIHVTPSLKAQTIRQVQHKEEPILKKKLSATLVFAVILMLCAIALAAASHFGILDFAGRYQNSYVPKDAQDYVQSNVLHMENELVTADISELYYDGLICRVTVDVKPKSNKDMLLGPDMSMEDMWINMTPTQIEMDKECTETARDVYQSGGYEAAYRVDSELYAEGLPMTDSVGDYHLNEDGTLTLYRQWDFGMAQPERSVTFQLLMLPYTETLDELDTSRISHLEQTITLTEAAYDAQTYQNRQAVSFASVGVRIDQITLHVRAQDIHATIDYTVTDEEAYGRLEDGLWFEFINPDSIETEPYLQRLQSGLSGYGAVKRLDEDGLRYRQTETLGRNELHDVYTLRAYDAWEKDRFETQEVVMERVE